MYIALFVLIKTYIFYFIILFLSFLKYFYFEEFLRSASSAGTRNIPRISRLSDLLRCKLNLCLLREVILLNYEPTLVTSFLTLHA